MIGYSIDDAIYLLESHHLKPEEEEEETETPEREDPLEQVRQYVKNLADFLVRANKLSINVPKESESHVALVLNKVLHMLHLYILQKSSVPSSKVFENTNAHTGHR